MDAAAYAVHGDIAVITMNNPPVNGLGHPLRKGIVAGLDQALADANVSLTKSGVKIPGLWGRPSKVVI